MNMFYARWCLLLCFLMGCSQETAELGANQDVGNASHPDMSGLSDSGLDSAGVEHDMLPNPCHVCRTECSGLERQENDRPFIQYSRVDPPRLLTIEEIESVTPSNGAFTQRVVRPPGTMNENGAAIWLNDGEDLILDLGIGMPYEVNEDLFVSAVLNDESAIVEIRAEDLGPESNWTSSDTPGVATIPFDGKARRFAIRIPGNEFKWGEMNTLFVALRMRVGRPAVYYPQFKWTVYAGGFDIPAIPCVADQGLTSITEEEARFERGQFEFIIDGKLESRQDELDGFTATPGEVLSTQFYALPGSYERDVDDIVAVGFFMQGALVAGPFKYVAHDTRHLSSIYIGYRDTFEFKAPETPGVYNLEMIAWYHPDQPEIAFDGSPMFTGPRKFPDVRGKSSSTFYNSGTVQITVIPE